jgi:hypothetical protein
MNRTPAPFRFDPVLRDLSNHLHAVDRADAIATEAVDCPGLLEFRDALAAVAAGCDRSLRRLRDAWMENPGVFMREMSDQLCDSLAEGAENHLDALECDAREVLGDW